MKTLNQLTELEYSQLYSSGKLWDKYPAATGDRRKDLDCRRSALWSPFSSDP